ncbi:hypothetical protein [Streptomyces sp. NPDC005125]
MAPFTEDSWHVRIGRIANWAGVLRLAAREQGEIWMKQLLKGELPPEDEIATAEGYLTGPGSIEDLELFFYD